MKRDTSSVTAARYELCWAAWRRSHRVALFSARSGRRLRYLGLLNGRVVVVSSCPTTAGVKLIRLAVSPGECH